MWKKRQPRSLPSSTTYYPSGVCLETEKGFYLLRGNKRYRIPTQRVLNSWAFPLTVETTEAAVQHYRIAARVGFRDGSLIYNVADGKIYLISQNKRRHVVSPEALELIGIKPSDAVKVSEFESNLQEVGEQLG